MGIRRFFKINIFCLALTYFFTLYSSCTYSLEKINHSTYANTSLSIARNDSGEIGWKESALPIPVKVGNSIKTTDSAFVSGFAAVMGAAISFGAVVAISTTAVVILMAATYLFSLPPSLIYSVPVLALIYAFYKSSTLVFKKNKEKKYSNFISLDESERPSFESSFFVPVSATGQVDKKELKNLIKSQVKAPSISKSNIKGNYNIKFANLAGVTSYFDLTLSEFSKQVRSETVVNYMVVLSAEDSPKKAPKPRQLLKRDVEFLLNNRTFLHHNAKANLTQNERSAVDFILEKIQFYASYITENQLDGCLLHVMVSKGMTRVVFVPFS